MRTPDRRPRDADLLDHRDGPWGDRGDDQTVDTRGAGGRELALPEDHWHELEAREEIEQAARTRRVPHLMTAVTAGVGAGAWGCERMADVFAGPAAATGVQVAVVAGSALSVPVARALLRASIPDRWARTWWTATSCAAGWVNILVAQGASVVATPEPGLWMGAALVLGSAALGARWADEHEVPDPGEHDPPEPAPEPAPQTPRRPTVDTSRAAEIERDWDTEVAHGKNPIAPASQLVGRAPLPHGWRWIVHLDRGGSVTCTQLEDDGIAARVALKLGIRSTHVMLERLDGEDEREDRAVLTVVTRDVLAGGVRYRGPRYDAGVIPIGDYADGTPDACWRAYDPTGVLCGLITGGQGSGKSALMAALGMALRRSGEWVVLFGDGDEGGNSSHLLGEVAHDFARGPAEVLQQLEGLEAIGLVRGHLMGTLTTGRDGAPTPITPSSGQTPVTKIMPCPAFPGIVWILDEFYRLAHDPELQRVNFVDRVEAMVRILRKYGGAVIVGTQSALGDDFDGNSALRGMLASGNSVALRSKNKSEQGIVNDGFAPSALPKGGGYAFLGEGDRRAMIRTEHPHDMGQWAAEVTRHGRPDPRSWAAFTRYRVVRELDPVADLEERMAALAEFDDAIASGAPLPGSPQARAADADSDADQDAPGQAPVAVGGFAVPTLTGNVVPIRPDVADQPVVDQPVEQSVVDQPEPNLADEPAAAGPLPDKARQVLDDLAAHPGPRRSAAIVTATGLPAPAVSKALRLLVERGLAHRPSGVQGVHAAGPPPHDQQRDQEISS